MPGTAEPVCAETRADGWPLCPRCFEDELMSQERYASPQDELNCLACGWEGKIDVFVPQDSQCARVR